MSDQEHERLWVGTKMAGQILGMPAVRVRRLAASGDLIGRRVGKEWLFRYSYLRTLRPEDAGDDPPVA